MQKLQDLICAIKLMILIQRGNHVGGFVDMAFVCAPVAIGHVSYEEITPALCQERKAKGNRSC
jgi:hypothetical protein